MGKRKTEEKDDNISDACEKNELPFGQYNVHFHILRNGNTSILRDKKSDQSVYIPIKATEDKVYVAEPDGEMIPQIEGQHKCDYLIYCAKRLQTCYIELKGKNISSKEAYNPYDQIIDTRKYFRTLASCECLFAQDMESHAFIVSPEQQRIPKGVELKERALWQELVKYRSKPIRTASPVHYVRVTPSSRYSDNGQKIICSSRSPIPMPYIEPE